MSTNLAMEAWKKRWNHEAKSRKAISDAFKVYKEMYGEKSAEQVVQLARQYCTKPILEESVLECNRAPGDIEWRRDQILVPRYWI